MKIVFSLALLVAAQAKASGCIGGEWKVIEEKNLPRTEIQKHFGEPEYLVRAYPNSISPDWRNTFSINWQKLRVGTTELTFGTVRVSEADLIGVINYLNRLPEKFKVRTQKTVEFNGFYDDCLDVPENTTRTTITYSFEVPLRDGNKQHFSEMVITYDPPVEE